MKTILAVSALSAALHAAVIYDFSGTGQQPPETVAFQLMTPSFVSPGSGFVDFTCAEAISTVNCDPSVPFAINFSVQPVLGQFSAQLGFVAANLTQYAFFFATGAFGSPGTYSSESGSSDNAGTLTVTVTPEPTTASLVVITISLCFCLAIVKRRSQPDANRIGLE
jgi:hypothetical protein